MSAAIENGRSLRLEVAKQLHREQRDLGRYGGNYYVVQMVNVLIGTVKLLKFALFSLFRRHRILFYFISFSVQAGTEGIRMFLRQRM